MSDHSSAAKLPRGGTSDNPVTTEARRLDEHGRCCGRKPVYYKGGSWASPPGAPMHFCGRCNREYGTDGVQKSNWAWAVAAAPVTITDVMRRAAPDALYPCETYECAEERTYPADELHWHPRHECFYCEGCHSGEHQDGDPRWGDAECPTLAQVLRAP